MTSQQLVCAPVRLVHCSCSVYCLKTLSQPWHTLIFPASDGSTPMQLGPGPAPCAIDGDTILEGPCGCLGCPAVMLLMEFYQNQAACRCCALPALGSKRGNHPADVASLYSPGEHP